MNQSADQIVQDVAKKIRDLFIDRYQLHIRATDPSRDVTTSLHPRWDGGQDSRGVNHKPVWLELARYSITHQIEPADWVDTLFHLTHHFDHQPRPTDLYQDVVVQSVGRSESRRYADILAAVRAELLVIRRELFFNLAYSGLSPDVVKRTVILSPALEVSPLTRYVIAGKENQPDLVNSLTSSARAQFSCSSEAYIEAYGSYAVHLQSLIPTSKRMEPRRDNVKRQSGDSGS